MKKSTCKLIRALANRLPEEVDEEYTITYYMKGSRPKNSLVQERKGKVNHYRRLKRMYKKEELLEILSYCDKRDPERKSHKQQLALILN